MSCVAVASDLTFRLRMCQIFVNLGGATFLVHVAQIQLRGFGPDLLRPTHLRAQCAI